MSIALGRNELLDDNITVFWQRFISTAFTHFEFLLSFTGIILAAR